MGLFSLKAVCGVCNEKCGLDRFLLKNGEWCCRKCFNKTGLNSLSKIKSPEEIKNLIANKEGSIQLSDNNTICNQISLPENTVTNKQITIPKNVGYEFDSLKIESDKLIAYKTGVVSSIWYFSSYSDVVFIPADANSNYAHIVFLKNNDFNKKKEQKDLKGKHKISFCMGILQLARTNQFVSPIFTDISNAFTMFHQNIAKNNNAHLNFKATRSVGDYLNIDEANRKVELINKNVTKILNFEDIIDFQIIKDQTAVSSSDWSNVLLGGVLFGGTGAIVGSLISRNTKDTLRKLSLIVITKNSNFAIDFVSEDNLTNLIDYHFISAQLSEVCTSLEHIIKSSAQPTSSTNFGSLANDLRELKSLLDAGIITQEEFDTKKKQFLNL